MKNRNILTAEQSRAEQSRAEQSRAEQSRAEQSRVRDNSALFCAQNLILYEKRRFDDTG